MLKNVIEHALTRLKATGIDDIFGVPGDRAFSVNDAINDSAEINWIGCSNELNAGYAADGYARVKGVGALCTTFGVGELSAINAIAGAYAELLPVFHLVGMPNMAMQSGRKQAHHTLGDGDYDLFRKMSEPVVIASAIMTPDNVVFETERLIHEALYHWRPVYMGFPADLALRPALGTAQEIPLPPSDATQLAAALEAIVGAIDGANSAVVLAGMLVGRAGHAARLQRLLDISGPPSATMFMGKSVIDEQHPNYIDMYDGALLKPEVRQVVVGADLVIDIAAPLNDFNSGVFTAGLDDTRTIWIGHHETWIGSRTDRNVELGDVLDALLQRLTRCDWSKRRPGKIAHGADTPVDMIDAPALYVRWTQFIAPGDVVVAETGTASMGLGFALLPTGASFHNQTLWGSISWATPAALGTAVAAPDRRTVLITGEGSHQMTVQELGQFARLGVKPAVFVLNNDGYLIERLPARDGEAAYNDVAPWRYTELPHALSCDDWLCLRVSTCGELDEAMVQARAASTGVYIEVVTGRYVSSDLTLKLQTAMQAIYKAS